MTTALLISERGMRHLEIDEQVRGIPETLICMDQTGTQGTIPLVALTTFHRVTRGAEPVLYERCEVCG